MVQQLQLDVPFGLEEIEEVPLPAAPLESVVAQVRFPPVTWIADQDSIAPFQRAIYEKYPVLRPERTVNVVVTPEGANQGGRSTVVWRFTDKSQQWQVSLATDFLALDIKRGNYTSRAEFVQRFEEILNALDEFVHPAVYERLGIRYVDRVVLEQSNWQAELRPLMRQELLGMAGVDLTEDAFMSRTVCDSEFRFSDAVLHARWGLVPANTALDSMHGDPINKPTWLLDLDMYSPAPHDFEVTDIVERTKDYAERIYGFFRWAVTADFLRRYGADV